MHAYGPMLVAFLVQPIAKSLVGDYRHEHLFTLKQSLAAYRSDQKLIEDCDREIRQHLEEFQPPTAPS